MTGRLAIEPMLYRAVKRPNVCPLGSPKYDVQVSRIRRLFNMELASGSVNSGEQCAGMDSPIVTGGGRADAKNDAVEVELAHVGRLAP